MQTPEPPHDIGCELAALINSLPAEERVKYIEEIGRLVHDVRAAVGVIHTAETLLRRKLNTTAEDIELFDMIHHAGQRMLGLMADFSQPYNAEAAEQKR